MAAILTEELSLNQYATKVKKNSSALSHCHPKYCPHCKKTLLWAHGHYFRKPDRSKKASLNPVRILRFLCRLCRRTCSIPYCLPRRRWYSWEVQEQVLKNAYVKSLKYLSKLLGVSRSTCRRWIAWLKEKYLLYRSVLLSSFSELGQEANEALFWQRCWQKLSLANLMRLCQCSGVNVP